MSTDLQHIPNAIARAGTVDAGRRLELLDQAITVECRSPDSPVHQARMVGLFYLGFGTLAGSLEVVQVKLYAPEEAAVAAANLEVYANWVRPGHGGDLDQPQQPPPARALSQRELEVLRLLDTELTGPEIGRQLFITVNTLRTHTKRIFTKLDAKTRSGAVQRAYEAGLL